MGNARRFIYNCDGNNLFLYKDYPMTPGDVYEYVDRIAGTDVTTFFMSCHVGMDMNFQGEVSDLVASRCTPDQAERFKINDPTATSPGTLERSVVNLHALVEAGHDPLGLVIERAQEKGLETFVTFRLNEVHSVEQPDSILLSRFWKEHPEWHIGTPGDELPALHREILGPVHPIVATWLPGGLNFAVPEVRARRFAQLREICERYPVDGIDLDFQRFPIYFPFGEEAKNIPVMTEWVRQVRRMTREVGRARGRPILLSARVMARPEQNLGLGLDPVTWAKENLLDFITVSHYLRNTFPLPIAEYRRLLPADLPLYASIEFAQEAETYREIARRLWRDGVDGIMLFNFFAARESGREPPYELLYELGDPAKIGGGNASEE